MAAPYHPTNMYLEIAWLKRGYSDTSEMLPEDLQRREAFTAIESLFVKTAERLQEYFNPIYQHVELRFGDRATGEIVATGATESRPLFWYANKTYSRANWDVRRVVNIPEPKVDAMYKFCLEAYQASEMDRKTKGGTGNVASPVDQIRSITPWPRRGGNYFCSEYVVCAFHAAGYFRFMSPESTVPFDIFELVTEKFQTVCVFKGQHSARKNMIREAKAPSAEMSQYAALEKLYDTM